MTLIDSSSHILMWWSWMYDENWIGSGNLAAYSWNLFAQAICHLLGKHYMAYVIELNT